MISPRLRYSLPALLPLILLSSCASMKTRQDQYVESVPLAQEGAYDEAARIIRDAREKKYKEKDRVLYYLDLGMLYHWAGKYEKSNEMLTKAEFAIEELFTKSFSRAALSGMLNDNALDYSGEDYEDIYLNIFKSLNFIALGNEESALVEIRRVQIKLDLLEDKYKNLIEEYNDSPDAEGALEFRENRFHNDALARYLSLLLYRSEGSFDDARIDREALDDAWAAQQQIYGFPKPEFPAPEMADDQVLVNLLAFSGLGPTKHAETLYLHSGPGIVYVAITGQDDDYVDQLLGFTFLPVPGIPEGMHFKIQFPRLSHRGTEADRVVLLLDGQEVAEASLLEPMDAVAEESFKLRQPLTVGKTIIRATVKNVSKEVGKAAMQDSLSDQGAGGFFVGLLAGLAADVAVDATENADLRISHFFPSQALVAELAVTPGTYEVAVEYRNGDRLLARIDHGTREFTPGGLNLIESYALR